MQLIVPSTDSRVKVSDHGDWVEVELVGALDNTEKVRFLAGHCERALCLPLNWQAQIQVHVGSGNLDATAHKKTGLVGAKVALADTSLGMQRAAEASDLWVNKHGGPWALHHGPNRYSYLRSYPDVVNAANLGDWIEICSACGITQLDFVHCIHYGGQVPRPACYPGGLNELTGVCDRLRAVGIQPLLHSYAPAISIGCKELQYIEDSIPFNANYRLVGSERLLCEVANRLARLVDACRFEGIYFDAADWCNQIEGPEWGWWWARKIVHEVGLRLGWPDLIVESAMPGSNDWQVLSRWGSRDMGKRSIRQHVDLIVADYTPARWMPPTIGWLDAAKANNLGEIRYACRRAAEINAGMSWQGICPSRWDQPFIRRAAEVIREFQ